MPISRNFIGLALLVLPSVAHSQSVTGGSSEIANFRFAPEDTQTFTLAESGISGTMESGTVFSKSTKSQAGSAFVFSVKNSSSVARCVTFTFEHRGEYGPEYDSDRIAVLAPPKSTLYRFEARYDKGFEGRDYMAEIRKIVMSATDASSPTGCQ